ncbi:MAG TPA: hypothetical protein VEV21_07330 [Burkholderiales bacterium]|nr:hypothetical protein [Burkholderiales bacterium]
MELLGLLVVLEPLESLGLVVLDEPELMPELDDPELMPPEVAPLAPCSLRLWASHSARLIWPSWLVSILSNSSWPADEAPAADEVPPVDDDPLDDGVLLCDVEGEALEPELDLFLASSA